MDARLTRLDEGERADLYRLLVQGAGLWHDEWPASGSVDHGSPERVT